MAPTLPKKDLDETNILDITVEKPGLFEKFFFYLKQGPRVNSVLGRILSSKEVTKKLKSSEESEKTRTKISKKVFESEWKKEKTNFLLF
jgi:hypothetical protein